MAFCPKCGEKLIPGDAFCRSCGNPISQSTDYSSGSNGRSQTVDDEYYPGSDTPEKCPECGEPLEPGTLVCPACDYPIVRATASKVVNAFIQELSQIETAADEGTVSYARVVREIDAFPIPRTAPGVLAFLSLAQGRISTSLRDYGQGPEAKEAVLRAWVAKAQHAYDSAKLMFGDSPEFAEIEAEYQGIRSASARKKATVKAESSVNRFKNAGCLTKVLYFYIAIFALAVVLAVLQRIASNTGALLVVALAAIVAFFIYRNSKQNNAK